jgi:serine/threonine protein phosphatase PrpC
MIRAAGLTDIGCERQENQDSMAIDGGLALFLVADGMGGGPAGAEAARHVMIGFSRLLAERARALPEKTNPRIMREALRDCVLQLGRELCEAGDADLARKGMGTTVAAVWVRGCYAHLVHMGDSRIYLFRDNTLRLLTADHSIAALLLRNGEISEEEAARHPARGQLSRFVGMAGDTYPDVSSLRLHANDRLLLCTDGLWGAVEAKEMQTSMSCQAEPEAVCRELVECAKGHGGADNITALVILTG